MPETLPIARPLGYALNVFPYHSLAELRECLGREIRQLKERASPGRTFPVELRFSELIARELQQDCDEVARLKYLLDAEDLALITVNGFVMPEFHGRPVKERVYLPAWHESDARARFTISCLDLLAQLAPMTWEGEAPDEPIVGTEASARREARPPANFYSVSVPFGALKPVSMDAIAPPILRCARHAESIRQRTGVPCVVALEPEPGLTVETTAEAVTFFERFVPDELRPYLGLNFDLSHQLVEFEDLGASLATLHANGVPVAKIHVSNAAEMTELRPFQADSIYLHQVCGINARGERAYFSLDWPADPPPADIVRFRVHYHLPVCPQPDSPVATTLAEVERFLAHSSNLPFFHSSIPFIVETYTWPEHLRGRGDPIGQMAAELEWVHEKMCLSLPRVGL